MWTKKILLLVNKTIKAENLISAFKFVKIEYLLEAIKDSPQILINLLVEKVELYDDKVIIYYNYSNKEKTSDGQETASREFLIYENLHIAITLNYFIVEMPLKRYKKYLRFLQF